MANEEERRDAAFEQIEVSVFHPCSYCPHPDYCEALPTAHWTLTQAGEDNPLVDMMSDQYIAYEEKVGGERASFDVENNEAKLDGIVVATLDQNPVIEQTD